MGRAASVEKEIRFVLEREEIANCFAEMLDRHELPLRVTHNDTKLNNVMLDDKTGKGICVIDLDTVMPGLAMNDFGIPSVSVQVRHLRMRQTLRKYPAVWNYLNCIRKDF